MPPSITHSPWAKLSAPVLLKMTLKAQGNERVDRAVAEAGKQQLKRRGACTSGTHLILTVASKIHAREARRSIVG